MKKFISLFVVLLMCIMCTSLYACATTPPPGDDGGAELSQAELAVIYESAADSAYGKTGISKPSLSLLSCSVPDETHIATTPAEIQQVKLNVGGMPAVLQLFSDLYSNSSFVMSDSVYNFSAQVEVPSGPNQTDTIDQEYSFYTTVDLEEDKIYLEASVVVNGMMQYNYCEIDYDFTNNEIKSFRYLAHMGFLGVYGDVIYKENGDMYINDFANPSSDFIAALDAMKNDFVAKINVGVNLGDDYNNEVQNYLNTINAIQQGLNTTL